MSLFAECWQFKKIVVHVIIVRVVTAAVAQSITQRRLNASECHPGPLQKSINQMNLFNLFDGPLKKFLVQNIFPEHFSTKLSKQEWNALHLLFSLLVILM